jgi:GNAT superfamily N-acetyltransferase
MPSMTTTYLEMRSPQGLRPKRRADERFWISEAKVRLWQFNRFLYFAVGEAWSRNDKRPWTDAQGQEYVASPQLRTFGAYYDDQSGIEIAYFGLLPAFIGRGLGGALLTNAIDEAWQMSPGRVWVHTCTLDHPSALANYQARGVEVYKVESPQ